MDMITPVQYGSVLSVAAALLVLTAIAVGVMTVSGLRMRRDYLGAIGRAVVQLTLVAVVIAWIFANPEGTIVYFGVMLVAATATSVRRVRCGWRNAALVGGPIALATVIAVVPVVVTGALPLSTQAIVPFTAQVIGGAMTAVSLTGSYALATARKEWPLVEGRLAIGATARQAGQDIAREAAQRSLTPGFDQTRSAGLVVLPGAFVGMLLGGATPAEAAQIQLLVLAALAVAAVVAAAGAGWSLAPWIGGIDRTDTAHRAT